jgi:hypothetical protein
MRLVFQVLAQVFGNTLTLHDAFAEFFVFFEFRSNYLYFLKVLSLNLHLLIYLLFFGISFFKKVFADKLQGSQVFI